MRCFGIVELPRRANAVTASGLGGLGSALAQAEIALGEPVRSPGRSDGCRRHQPPKDAGFDAHLFDFTPESVGHQPDQRSSGSRRKRSIHALRIGFAPELIPCSACSAAVTVAG